MPREEEEIQDANAVEPLDFWISLSPHRRRPCVLNAGALWRVYSPASEPEGCSGPVQAPQGTSSSALKARILFILFSPCSLPAKSLQLFFGNASARPFTILHCCVRCFCESFLPPVKPGAFFAEAAKKRREEEGPPPGALLRAKGQGPPSPTRYPAVFPRL